VRKFSGRVTADFILQHVDRFQPVSTVARLFQDERFLLVLDSAVDQRADGRYSILTADPVDVCRIDRCNYGDDPFQQLRNWATELPNVQLPDIPFCGGLAGLLSYELGQAFEKLPRPACDDFQTPALLVGLFDWAIVWDHHRHTMQVCGCVVPGISKADLQQRIDRVLQRLSSSADESGDSERDPKHQPNTGAALPVGLPRFKLPAHQQVTSPFSRTDYLAAVQRVIDYIHAGDIFQANLAQQLTAPWEGSALSLFEQVLRHNPAPFAGFLQAGDFAIVSASPERFLKVTENRFVETRPIKGTRRRHRSPIADLYTSSELSASAKDRAENVMIVDLLRNDLSRVCAAGTVKVTGLCEIEIFETVQHLVSTVVGELRPDADVWDLLAASVPGGSITGAPKIRAMEIIAELEPAVRGAYCGNLFCYSANGQFDSSILIRTFTLKQQMVQFPVGGGIVADSVPADEYQETLHKAAGMLRCLNADSKGVVPSHDDADERAAEESDRPSSLPSR
jgi:para-aminobenzoate synthetase component 1